jgi:hypothetical protein
MMLRVFLIASLFLVGCHDNSTKMGTQTKSLPMLPAKNSKKQQKELEEALARVEREKQEKLKKLEQARALELQHFDAEYRAEVERQRIERESQKQILEQELARLTKRQAELEQQKKTADALQRQKALEEIAKLAKERAELMRQKNQREESQRQENQRRLAEVEQRRLEEERARHDEHSRQLLEQLRLDQERIKEESQRAQARIAEEFRQKAQEEWQKEIEKEAQAGREKARLARENRIKEEQEASNAKIAINKARQEGNEKQKKIDAIDLLLSDLAKRIFNGENTQSKDYAEKFSSLVEVPGNNAINMLIVRIDYLAPSAEYKALNSNYSLKALSEFFGNSTRGLVNKIISLKNELQSCEFDLSVQISCDVFKKYIFNNKSIAEPASRGQIKLGDKIYSADDLVKADLKKLLDPKSFDILSPEYEKCEYIQRKLTEAKVEIMSEFIKKHPGANEQAYKSFEKFISEREFRNLQETFNGFERYLKGLIH